MSKGMPSTTTSIPETEDGNMDKDKDRAEDTVAGTAAVAECRLIGRKQPPMIRRIVGGCCYVRGSLFEPRSPFPEILQRAVFV